MFQFQTEFDTIRVDVPVGRMLPEPREVEVCIDRDGAPLALRLRLIPGKAGAVPSPRREAVAATEDPYLLEIGGSD
ncbi:MAG: hypothetical protein ACRC7O_01230 [Fimbriiglobus sp.]